MKRALVLVLLLACAREPAPKPRAMLDGAIEFRVLSERAAPRFCNEAPDFAVATSEEGWIDVFDVHTECRSGEIELPAVSFPREVAVAAWWARVPCEGHGVRTVSVARVGDDVVVTTRTRGPRAACTAGSRVHQLESFLALERSSRLSGRERVRFVLDGRTVGTARVP